MIHKSKFYDRQNHHLTVSIAEKSYANKVTWLFFPQVCIIIQMIHQMRGLFCQETITLDTCCKSISERDGGNIYIYKFRVWDGI